MIEILRWFLGWSEIKIEGKTNDFLTEFKKYFWMVRKQGKFIIARCMTKDFEQLKKESINYGCFVVQFRRVGFLNFLKRYKFRSGLLIGLMTFFLLIFISGFFVWNVEIFGNFLVTDEEIFNVCDFNGLYPGAPVFAVDEKKIEHILKEKFPEISWISINRIAGKYLIEISELKEKPKIVTCEGPCDVISKADGEILYIETYRGTPFVNVGDHVEKGQVLVTSAQKINVLDKIIYSPSDAKVIASVKHHSEFKLKKNSFVDQKTGIQKLDNEIFLLGLKIPLMLHRKKDNLVKVCEKLKPLEFFKIRLPALLHTTFYDVYEKINVENDIAKIRRILIKKQKDMELEKFMGNKILSRKYRFKEDGEEVVLKADVFVEERIDEKIPIIPPEEDEEEKKEEKQDDE